MEVRGPPASRGRLRPAATPECVLPTPVAAAGGAPLLGDVWPLFMPLAVAVTSVPIGEAVTDTRKENRNNYISKI